MSKSYYFKGNVVGQGYLSYLRFLRKIGGCMHFFQSYRDFMLDPVRRTSPQYEFSVMWHRNQHPLERWRLFWIEKTGEIVAVCQSYFYKQSLICIPLTIQPTLVFAQQYMNRATEKGEDFNKLVLDKVFTFIDWSKVDELKNRR